MRDGFQTGLVADAEKMKKGLNQAETVVDTQANTRVSRRSAVHLQLGLKYES